MAPNGNGDGRCGNVDGRDLDADAGPAAPGNSFRAAQPRLGHRGRRPAHGSEPGQPVGHGPRLAHAPLWVSDNGTDVTTLYSGRGSPRRAPRSRSRSSCPSPAGRRPDRSPTRPAASWSTTAAGQRLRRCSSSTRREPGTITGWNPERAAGRPVDAGRRRDSLPERSTRAWRSPDTANGTALYAADFHGGHDRRLRRHASARRSLSRPFTDAQLPGRLRAVQRPGARRQALRRLRQAGRRRRGRGRRRRARATSTSTTSTATCCGG